MYGGNSEPCNDKGCAGIFINDLYYFLYLGRDALRRRICPLSKGLFFGVS